MDSPRQSKRSTPNRETKRSQHQPGIAPQKDAYARLLSQHHSSKFSLYLEQYSKDLSLQREGNTANPLLKVQSERLNIPQRKWDHGANDFSDSSDFSPSSIKSRGDESSLSLYMEKLSTRSTQQDGERKQGLSDRQRRGQRRDTATSHDGDIESGEELSCLKHNESKKHQKQQQQKNKDLHRDVDSKETNYFVGQSPKKSGASGQEHEKVKKSKKKNLPKHLEEEQGGTLTREADKPVSRPRSPHSKGKKLQKPGGNLSGFKY